MKDEFRIFSVERPVYLEMAQSAVVRASGCINSVLFIMENYDLNVASREEIFFVKPILWDTYSCVSVSLPHKY